MNVAGLRADFPALHQEIHGKPLVYLDNAATTHKPRAVLDALDRFHRRDNSNVHRGVHTLSQRATDSYEGARQQIAQFLGGQKDEIVFVRGATEAINLVANAFLRPRLQPGDEVLVTAMEHHANIVPWQLACDATGAQLRVAPMSQAGELLLDELEALLTDRTKLLALTHVSNALGTVNPVAQIAEMAHAHGVPVLVDGAQAVQHMPVDVTQLGVDFYALSGHKLYGPTGIGVLWARSEHLEAMAPWQGGGDMIRSVTFEKTEFAPPPLRFEAGTPHIAGAIGLGAAVEYLSGIGLEAIAAHESDLLAAATDAVAAIDGVRLIGTAAQKASVLSFVVEGVHPHDIGTVLDRNGIAVRTGHHCAQPVMAFYGVPATVRASFALYNYRAEIEPLCTALHEAQDLFA
ncbi:MAG: cysteine desulfurase [Candidatus Poseidoniia archaeon]|jgi:cysteine desulfurase/selenocysteine lyase|nr:cysteine desulfurase [Candidatus Poseidoniia archaeon]MDP7243155.1 cysteine desulfurase [Candidatus Poseidoniia archaeon]MDP7607538.1 cysteine desulfurase [Candidatus Poseidoniia archaeon]|tara:strand:+ start:636 stop:1847 length:1212 start_codon:yes stop_codon:yes gene_type:complete